MLVCFYVFMIDMLLASHTDFVPRDTIFVADPPVAHLSIFVTWHIAPFYGYCSTEAQKTLQKALDTSLG